jgi:hypothetical protein
MKKRTISLAGCVAACLLPAMPAIAQDSGTPDHEALGKAHQERP